MSNKNRSGMQAAADLARAAQTVYKLARAALAGGLHGLAVQAAKSFAPSLIKYGIIALAVLLLIPFMVIAALPSFLFGFDNNEKSEDVQAMTDKAKTIEEAYESVRDVSNRELQRLIDQLSQGYDDVQVDMDIDYTNHYWYIAICSVAYKQDLFAMNEEDIRNGKSEGLSFETSEETYTEANGETIKTLNRLKIKIKELNPYELMDKLGFTEEQKNWALLIYRSMIDDQTIDEDNPDYIGSSGVDFSDVRFTEGSTEVVYYNQADARWGSLPYGKTGTIARSACGPTSLAMVVSSLTDRIIEPPEMVEWAYKNGYRAEGNGSYHSLIPEGAKHFGLNVEGAAYNEEQKIVDALASGRFVIAIMTKGHFTNGGHYIVLRGVTAEGKILVADSASLSRSEREWDLSLILGEVRRDAGAGGPLWIIG